VIPDAAAEAALDGLRREKEMIALTDEMSRRVGLDIKVGRRVLAAAKLSSRDVDMKAVAWGIKRAAEGPAE
jgi:hypothetical protein